MFKYSITTLTMVCACSVASVMSDFCNPMDYSPLGYSVHEICLARILEWVAMPYIGAPPDSEIKPESPVFALQADSLPLNHQWYITEPPFTMVYNLNVD